MKDIDEQIEELLGRLVDELERQYEAGELKQEGSYMRRTIECGGFYAEKYVEGYRPVYSLVVSGSVQYLGDDLSARVGAVFTSVSRDSERVARVRELEKLKDVVSGFPEKV
jgi:hypothetical protein